jgi:hypothetical protein
MLNEKILGTIDSNVRYFIWYANRHLSPLCRTLFSCDGHGKEFCYVVINPVTIPLFEQFREALTDIEGIAIHPEILAGKKRWKLKIYYSTVNELFERQEFILRVGEKLCRKTTFKKSLKTS